eukprot:296580-Pyramimonas_sp.AAC.1
MNSRSTEVQKVDGLDKVLTSKLPDAKRVLGESKFNAALVAACGLKHAIETLAKEDKILNRE